MWEASLGSSGDEREDLTYSCFFLLWTVSVSTQPHLSQRQERLKMKSVEKHGVSKSHLCFHKAPNPGRFFWIQLILYTKEKHVQLFKSWYFNISGLNLLYTKAKNERRKKNVLLFRESSNTLWQVCQKVLLYFTLGNDETSISYSRTLFLF